MVVLRGGFGRVAAVFTQAWAAYNTQLARKPLMTKCLTGAVGMMISDVVAQAAVPPPVSEGGKHQAFWRRYDAARTARMCAWSFVLATPLAHYWFNFLDKWIMVHKANSMAAAASKMLLDQAFMTPVGLCIFFLSMKALEGKPHMAVADIKEKLGKACFAAWSIWPVANFVNFRWVPLDLRILYVNVISIFFGAILSHIQAGKAPIRVKEKAEDDSKAYELMPAACRLPQ